MFNRMLPKQVAILGIAIATLVTTSCNEDDTSPLCLTPPCGEVDESATNLTVLNQNSEDIIGNIVIIIDDVETVLSLDGINKSESNYFSCWQTVPDFGSQSVVVIGYELNDEPIVGALNATLVSSNQLVLKINGDDVILGDYTECDDM